MLITFSGLDGAGKSTLIQWLVSRLQRDGVRVTTLHINTAVGLYAYARFLRDGVRALFARRNGTDGAHRVSPSGGYVAAPAPGPGVRGMLRRIRRAIIWSKRLRQVIYLIDLLLFAFYRLYIEKLRRRVLIMDRYFYDSLVDVADDRNWKSIRLLERLTPVPDLAILLDVPPEQANRRKQEQPFSYLERRWRAYRIVFPWIPNSVILGNENLHATKAALYGLVRARLDQAAAYAVMREGLARE